MNKYRILYRLMIPIILFSVTLFSQDKIGTTAASFLKLGAGARAAALGFSSYSLANDASALYWNPGALGVMKSGDLMLSYNKLYADFNHYYIGFTSPVASGSWGIGAAALVSGKMIRTEANPYGSGFVQTGEFTNVEGAVLAGYGVSVYNDICLGFTLKGIVQGLAEEYSGAFAADIGLFAKYDMIDFGFAVKNIGAKMKVNNIEYDLPFQIAGGASVNLLDNRLLAIASIGSTGEEKTQFSVGSEYKPVEYLALRVGYRTGLNDIKGDFTGITAGLGLFSKNIRIDYAYNSFGDLGDVHFITLGFNLSGQEQGK